MAKPSSAKEQDNLVCQDVIRNGLDRAVDVTQTLRDGAPSAQDLTSRPASGRLTAFLKLDVKQLKEAVAAPPAVARCLQQTESLFAENYELFSAPSTFSDILVSSASEAKTSVRPSRINWGLARRARC